MLSLSGQNLMRQQVPIVISLNFEIGVVDPFVCVGLGGVSGCVCVYGCVCICFMYFLVLVKILCCLP